MKRFVFWLVVFVVFVVVMYHGDRIVAFFKGGRPGGNPHTAAGGPAAVTPGQDPPAPLPGKGPGTAAAKPPPGGTAGAGTAAKPPANGPAATAGAGTAAKPPPGAAAARSAATPATPLPALPVPPKPKRTTRVDIRVIEKDATCTVKELRRRTEYRLLDLKLDEVIKASDFVLLQGDNVVPALGFVAHRRSESGWRPLVTAVGPPAKSALYRELEKGAVPGSTHLLFSEGKVTTDENTALVLLFPGAGQQGLLLFREEELGLDVTPAATSGD